MSTVSRDIRFSLLIVAFVIMFACVGLAIEGNWPKLLRVASAFTAYVLALHASGAFSGRLPRFLIAGAIAGAVSGIVRPELDPALIAASIVGAVAIAGTHWFGVTRWRALAPGLDARAG